MRRHPTAPVNVAGISVATSGTDFTAPERISERSSGRLASVVAVSTACARLAYMYRQPTRSRRCQTTSCRPSGSPPKPSPMRPRRSPVSPKSTNVMSASCVPLLKRMSAASRSTRACVPPIHLSGSPRALTPASTSRLSYGFVSGPGMYETSVTRPDLFRGYFTEQIGLLMQNHGVPVEIGEFGRIDTDSLCLSTRH